MSDSALCSAGFQEKRDFPFSSLKHMEGFFLLFFMPPLLSSDSCLSYSLHPAAVPPAFLFWFPLGVVEGHFPHWLTFRQEREGSQAGKKDMAAQ